MDFGLSRITRLIRDVYPKLPWKAIHIAGTNGKGSTSAFLSGLLHRAGVRVGRFNSPHLIERHDCISINEKPIDKDLFFVIEEAIQRQNEQAGIKATSFELLTATAFEAFARAKVEIGVIECGLGGARDATNVLNPDEVLCSVITPIALDHAEFLGDTIEAIAREKAGIIKKGVPVVVDKENDRRANGVFSQVAEQTESRLHYNKEYAVSIGKHLRNIPRESRERFEGPKDLNLPPHQLKNLALAYDAFLFARDRGQVRINLLSPDQALEVAAKVRKTWRGRMEWTSLAGLDGRKQEILIDGAHNPQAASLLRKYVDSQWDKVKKGGKKFHPMTWVIGMSSSKDVQETLSKLIREGDRVVLTQFGPIDGMPWATPASLQTLHDVAKTLTSETIRITPTPGEALRIAGKMTPEDRLIVVAGSLYLVSDILRLPYIAAPAVEWQSDENDRK